MKARQIFMVIVATREGDQLFFDEETGYFEDQKWKATRYESSFPAFRRLEKLLANNVIQDREDRYDSIRVVDWESLA